MFEAFWVLQQAKGDPSLSEEYDYLFDPTRYPKPERVDLPARENILDCLDIERQRTLWQMGYLQRSTHRSRTMVVCDKIRTDHMKM